MLEKFDSNRLELLLTSVVHTVTALQSVSDNLDFDAAFIQINQICESLKTKHFYLNELWKKKGDSLDHALQFKVFENDATQVSLGSGVFMINFAFYSINCGHKIK